MSLESPSEPRPQLSAIDEAANRAFADYLSRNVRSSLQLHHLHSRIEHFLAAAPRPFVSKCIDGRVHTSDEKGYPPATITYIRTEGTNVDLSPNNSRFWDRLHAVIWAPQIIPPVAQHCFTPWDTTE